MLQAIRDEHEIIPKIERFRELSKLAQTYLDALPAGSATTGACTRPSTRSRPPPAASRLNPNLQNIPVRTETGREIRACFVAEPGNVLISVDYSQVELRVLAHIANEQVLRDIFMRGEDVHTETAAAVFDTAPDQLTVGMRSKAKMVNYGIVYGLSAYGLADRLQIEQEEAQEFIDRYLERFPAVAQFMQDAVTQADEHGYVSTLFGRRRQIPEIRARNWRRASSASGSRSTPSSRAPPPTSSRSRWCAATTRWRRRHEDALHPPDPRRAAVRGAGGGDRAGDRDRAPRDGRRRRARPAARGRLRRRPELDGREVVDRGLAVVLTAVVGGMVALQAPINSPLGKTIGTFQATFFSFATGTIVLAVIAGLARGGYGQIAEARTLAPYYLIGGPLGACYVTTVLVTVRTLGAGGIVAASIAGQLTMRC